MGEKAGSGRSPGALPDSLSLFEGGSLVCVLLPEAAAVESSGCEPPALRASGCHLPRTSNYLSSQSFIMLCVGGLVGGSMCTAASVYNWASLQGDVNSEPGVESIPHALQGRTVILVRSCASILRRGQKLCSKSCTSDSPEHKSSPTCSLPAFSVAASVETNAFQTFSSSTALSLMLMSWCLVSFRSFLPACVSTRSCVVTCRNDKSQNLSCSPAVLIMKDDFTAADG